ncbi:MAG: protein kinase, partial [Gemmatimonadaceae bacterium]
MEVAGGGQRPDGAAGLPAAGYALERELGRGGMAVVYLARDRKHDRAVAVKVLHAELAAVVGAERFLQEIRVTAQLQHPHVLGLIDSGVFGPAVASEGVAGELAGRPYYVMPYVAGESLRARLAREGQLPVADALRIAREVAGALDHAHRHGVVHRDVKPENILLDEDGRALVADFGIALAVQQAGGARMTQTGLWLGTPQYMAPEQAMGERAVDARADVYALGAVTYEMLAGEPPFTGLTAQAVIAKAMTEAPRSLVRQRPSVPPHVEAAVLTALEKLPADRFPTAAAFAAALAEAAALPGGTRRRPAERIDVAYRRSRLATAAFAAAGALALGVALGRGLRPAPAARGEPVRFSIEPDSGTLRVTAPAISPDGRTVVFASDGPDGARLYARRVNELAARPLAGTEGGEWPVFSPDGAWIAFYSYGALRKVRLEGGPAALVVPLPATAVLSSSAWGADDAIFYVTGAGALYRVPTAGDSAARVAVRDSGVRLFTAQLLPRGRSALVTLTRGPTQNGVGVQMGILDLASGRIRQLGP